jgi:hypothetical protein
MTDTTEQQPATLTTPKLGLIDRLKKAVEVIKTGKAGVENPLSKEPDDKSRAALVAELNEWWLEHRTFWKPVFQKIERSMKFAAGKQWPQGMKSVDGSEPYQVDIVQRNLAVKEAMLYAKNPTFEARRKERMEFAVWDESEESYQGAKAMLGAMADKLKAAEHAKQLLAHAQQGVPITPEEHQAAQNLIAAVPPEAAGAQALIADYDAGQKNRAWEEAFGNTLRLLVQDQIDTQNPPYKTQLKQLVTRVNTCRVGYVKLLFQRDMVGTPTQTAAKAGLDETLATIKAKLDKASQPEAEADPKELAEIALMVENLQKEQSEGDGGEVTNEGVVLDFLPATSVIVDKNTTSLRGFVGAKRIVHEMLMDVEDAEREFGVSLTGSEAVLYTREGEKESQGKTGERVNSKEKPRVLIGYVYDRPTGLCYVICDGVKYFLKEPYAPQPEWDFFFPIIPLTFRALEVEKNDPDNDVTCYPRSDVELLMPMQKEKNRSGEGLVQHRESKKPGFIAVGTKWQPGDLAKLKKPREVNEVIVLESLAPGEKISDYIQPIPSENIDPKVYDTSRYDQDSLEVIGSQQADLGPTNNDTATQARIAEASKMRSSGSNIDDLDDFQTLLLKGMCRMLTAEMQEQTVKKKVGIGAIWPQLSRRELSENVWLELQAGSSGPPNQQLDMEIVKEVVPLAAKLPGVSVEKLVGIIARTIDPRIRIEDFYQKDSPSIEALNAAQSQPPPPKETVSINYKDAPDSIRAQMEIAAGFKPAHPSEREANKDETKTQKQPANA